MPSRDPFLHVAKNCFYNFGSCVGQNTNHLRTADSIYQAFTLGAIVDPPCCVSGSLGPVEHNPSHERRLVLSCSSLSISVAEFRSFTAWRARL